MVVQLRGGGFRNKGAQLMLEAAMEQLRAYASEAAIAINIRDASRNERKTARLLPVLWLDHWRLPLLRRLLNGVAAHLPDAVLSNHAVLPRHIDAVLDLSGYAYGDAWGPNPVRAAASYYAELGRQRTTVILLPQQLGPFRDRATREAFRDLARHCALIYARDESSYVAAGEVLGDRAKLRRAPDITVSLPGETPADFDVGSFPFRVCIVPNSRMVTRTTPREAAAYREFLDGCVCELRKRSLSFCLLLHDVSADDVRLAGEVRSAAADVPIVREENPRRVKGLLGLCEFTIGSRYHGLVSALSQGVPALGVGWTHKYDGLFDDFGCPELVVRMTDAPEMWMRKLELLLDPTERSLVAARIKVAAQRSRDESQTMWREVLAVLARGVTGRANLDDSRFVRRTTENAIHS